MDNCDLSQSKVDSITSGEKITVLDGDNHLGDLCDMTYSIPLFSFNLCHSGYMDVQYDSERRRFQARQVAILYPRHSLMLFKPSLDYKYTRILVSFQHLQNLAMLNMHIQRFVYEQSPQFELTEPQYNAVLDSINTLRHVLSLKSELRDLLSDYMLMVFMGMLFSFRTENEGLEHSSKAYLSPRLYAAIAENCYQHRDVGFYAKLFSLSPKHFSEIIKQETGKSAIHWIRSCLIVQIKQMLSTEPSATVQEIAYRFGFQDQTSFVRYFKRETGLTPTEYRQKMGVVGK